jgi:nucleoside-diphosphate-sugar epimerase
MSFTPAELAAAIERYIPGLRVDYQPDHRQAIAATWPESIDDSLARQDWNWDHQYELSATVRDMLLHLAKAPGIPLEQILELLPGGFY